MPDFIRGGTRWACPQCHRLQAFMRSVAPESLPIRVVCSFAECGFAVGYSTLDAEHPPVFPKVEPQFLSSGNWVIELQEKQNPIWQAAAAAGQAIPFRERANAIAGHVAGGLQCIASLKYDLDQLSEAFTAQFEGEWGIATNFLRHWRASEVNAFITQPFLTVKTLAADEFAKARTRLVLHPAFFVPELGIRITSGHGMQAQLITPYTQFSMPLERWFRAIADLPDALQLRVANQQVVGKDLFRCWKDIAGTEPGEEHDPDAPVIKITDSLQARLWLTRLGIPAWPLQPLETGRDFLYSGVDFFQSVAPASSHRRAWEIFKDSGRLAYFVDKPEQRNSAWEFAMSLGVFGMGAKLCLITDPRVQEIYAQLKGQFGSTSVSRSFHWKVVTRDEDLADLPLDAFKFIFVDYTREMPFTVLEALHRYQGRLLLIHTDPVMDLLETNWEASHFHSCVNAVFYEQDLLQSRPADYDLVHHSLVTAMLRSWKGD